MSLADHPEALRIQSGQGPYPVTFYPSVRSYAADVSKLPKAVALIDERVSELYANDLAEIRDSMPTLLLPALESSKTLAGVERTVAFLQQNRCNKEAQLIAVGGGIIQDIATFTSHLYYRGIRMHLGPTTLLSMSDSCIGAKCGINFGAFKNQLGVFHAPKSVAIAHQFLETLDDADIASGYGEILKLALTGSERDYDWVERAVSAGGFRNVDLPALISMALGVKKTVIEIDEYETDLRRILNYGHTFGHALESITDHAVPHGIGIAWGVDLANYVAMTYGLLERDTFERIHAFVNEYFSIEVRTPVTASALIDASRRDKKNTGGKLTMILPRGYGDLVVHQVDYDAKLEATIEGFLRLNHAFFGN